MSPINDPSTCEQAAQELNLVDVTVSFTDVTPRPEGCYFFFGEQLAFARNTANAGIGAVGPREPICQAVGATPTPAPTPVPTPEPTLAATTTTPPSPDPSPAPSLPVTTTFRKIQTGSCGNIGMQPINDPSACEQAAQELNLIDVSVAFTDAFPRPEGCYFFEETQLAFGRNPANVGTGVVGPREPICQAVDGTPTPAPTAAPPSPTQPPAASIRFVAEISEGTCSDVNGVPIDDEDICELAARVLGVPDTTASRTNRVPRPEGCYVFRGNRLIMAVNQENRGRGAETTTPGRSRHPICGFT